MRIDNGACLVGSLLALSATAGCGGSQEVVPETVSSASSVRYAEEWPDRLKTIRGRYTDGAKQARADIERIPGFPDALEEPDWTVVAGAYDRADRDGRSRAVAELILSARRIEEFVESRGKGVASRLGAHVNAALKRLECDCDTTAGTVSVRAVEDAVDHELEERYRELSEAHQVLEKHSEALDRQDRETLEEQVDTITATSFFVFVDAPMLRDDLGRLMEEVERIDETLDRAITVARAEAEAEGSSRRDKAAATERLERLEAARGPIEGLADETRVVQKTIDDDIVELRSGYESAIKQAVDAVADRASAPPPAGE